MLISQSLPRQVTLDDIRYVLRSNARVPDVVRIDEYDWSFMVAAGAGIAQHGGRREPTPLDLHLERLEEFSAALGTAAALPWSCAHKNLSELRHGLIL
jgi:hypothetical protein